METKYNSVLYLFILLFMFLGCSDQNKENKIVNNSYKGLGVFLYYEIDGGSMYEVKFIPFHFKDKEENITLKTIHSNPDNIVFERGISFGSFRDRDDILFEVFKGSKSCGDINYCFAYVDFEENEQKKIDKEYKKRGYASKVCIDEKKIKVIYDPTEVMAKYLIKIKTLKIIE